MDITQALKDTENALRDFISSMLVRKFGGNWVEHCGVTPERLAAWQERKIVEAKRQESGVVDERIIYYADFYDLKTILKKHWPDFSDALGEWKSMDVWLTTLERMRDPDAHRRELLPHQKHLALGIEGEIRSRLVRYRSKQETTEDYFPRIESVRDNLGNIWTPGSSFNSLRTGLNLRPGDRVEFVVTARDPLEDALEYAMRISDGNFLWQDNGNFVWDVADSHIGRITFVDFEIRSPRPFHASGSVDHRVELAYTVLPRKNML